jgi:hypothetical protein
LSEVAEDQEIAEELPDLSEDDESEEVLEISLGEESLTSEEEEEGTPANPWVNDLRKKYRTLTKQNRKLEAELQSKAKTVAPVEEAKPLTKPTMESCDFDEQKFESAVDDYNESKRLASEKAEKSKTLAESQDKERQKPYDDYAKEKAALKMDKDKIEENEENVIEALSRDQQDWLIKWMAKPAIMVQALGNVKVSEKLKELASITNEKEFVQKSLMLELQLKTSTSKRSKPKPEQSVKGGSKPTGGLQKSYDAAISKGDYTQAAKLKQQLK